jgi:hypothetical protein
MLNPDKPENVLEFLDDLREQMDVEAQQSTLLGKIFQKVDYCSMKRKEDIKPDSE